MENKITLADVLKLNPALSALTDVYRITTEDDFIVYLEVYVNSDFGCEYALYDDLYNDIDSGVVDECDTDDENAMAQLILDVLDEMNVYGVAISKLPQETEDGEDDVDAFQEKVYKHWEEKVAILKRTIKEEKVKCC